MAELPPPSLPNAGTRRFNRTASPGRSGPTGFDDLPEPCCGHCHHLYEGKLVA